MKTFLIIAMLLIACLGFRLFLALRLSSDEPYDGRVYARIALNVLEHDSYSVEANEPYPPTYIRTPAYPMFLAGCYVLFGHENNRAVRIVQAVVDTITCLLIGLLALQWAPSAWPSERKRLALSIATALAVACPFVSIYVATILTETLATFLVAACALSATLALKSDKRRRQLVWWLVAGLLGGLATLVRPDSGLFVAAIGTTMVAIKARRLVAGRSNDSPTENKRATRLAPIMIAGIALTIGFCAALTPWAIRNYKVFGIFQPIAPTRANGPNEFVPYGYIRWLKTWVDDGRYVEPFEWALDERQIAFDRIPERVFDSPEEREQVAELFQRYNGPPPVQPEVKNEPPEADEDDDQGNNDDGGSEEEPAEEEEEPAVAQPAGMTPELDAEFDRVARERISRSPMRYYLIVPAKRLLSMWFDTHSQYYPFEGSLFPIDSLNREVHQQYWLPVFAGLTWLYTLLGAAGAVVMLVNCECRRWLLLLTLLIAPRLIFLSTLENPEPRYVVELFAFVAAAAGIAVAALIGKRWLDKPLV